MRHLFTKSGAALFCALFSTLAATANAQDQFAPPDAPVAPLHRGSVEVSGSVRERVDGWNWFEDGRRDIYAFGESRLRLEIAQHRSRWDWNLEFEQPALLGLPDNAITPSGDVLGQGGTYFAANSFNRNAANLFIKQANITLRGFGMNGSHLTIGRLTFNDGNEGTAKDETIAVLKRERLSQRLIGDAEWTAVGRSLDGAHLSYDITHSTNFTFLAARPTSGVYDTNGWRDLNVDVAYAALTQEMPSKRVPQELSVFLAGYHDGRDILKVDDRPLAARLADHDSITIGTFGGHYIFTFKTPIGPWDFLGWGAVQTGHWGVLDHEAASGATEVGWRPPIPLHPWLRATAFRAGGDVNPNDTRHGTFVQPIPTEHWYARIPFYTLQNSEDFSGQLLLHPATKLWLHSEVHKVKLAERNDLWYQGDGPFQPDTFGYTGHPVPATSGGGLANYLDTNVEYRWTDRFKTNFYIGALSGKGIITTRPHGTKMGFAYAEFLYRF
jgi:hypothetical protein